jgi:hypothetical protein
VLSNWSEIQDYNHDYLIDYASEEMDGMLDVFVFEYTPGEGAEKASVSLHLTQRERQDIAKAVYSPHNRMEYLRLQSLAIGR